LPFPSYAGMFTKAKNRLPIENSNLLIDECLKPHRLTFLYSDLRLLHFLVLLLSILLDPIFSTVYDCHFVISHTDNDDYSTEHTVFGYPSSSLWYRLEDVMSASGDEPRLREPCVSGVPLKQASQRGQ